MSCLYFGNVTAFNKNFIPLGMELQKPLQGAVTMIRGILPYTLGQPPSMIRNNQLQGDICAHIFAV